MTDIEKRFKSLSQKGLSDDRNLGLAVVRNLRDGCISELREVIGETSRPYSASAIGALTQRGIDLSWDLTKTDDVVELYLSRSKENILPKCTLYLEVLLSCALILEDWSLFRSKKEGIANCWLEIQRLDSIRVNEMNIHLTVAVQELEPDAALGKSIREQQSKRALLKRVTIDAETETRVRDLYDTLYQIKIRKRSTNKELWPAFYDKLDNYGLHPRLDETNASNPKITYESGKGRPHTVSFHTFENAMSDAARRTKESTYPG